MTIALCAASAACAQNMPSGQLPNPAIVRIIAPESDGVSYGSGTLVAVNDTYGLVVTNWHVVRDAAAPVWVAFPNGFRSAATILKTDRDWDLAALAVWRPNVTPLPLATQPPRPGERLTIAGYGSGSFRAVSGQCTQYVSPGGNNPFEMIELSAPARNGDSGGPILNDRGEIAGRPVWLGFWSDHRQLLRALAIFFIIRGRRLPTASRPTLCYCPTAIDPSRTRLPLLPRNLLHPCPHQTTHRVPPRRKISHLQTEISKNHCLFQRQYPPNYRRHLSLLILQWQDMSWFDQIRNYLAVIGILAVLLQAMRVARKLAV